MWTKDSCEGNFIFDFRSLRCSSSSSSFGSSESFKGGSDNQKVVGANPAAAKIIIGLVF